MNIFAFHHDPHTAASMLDDKRVNKMILESVQTISTAVWENGMPTRPLTKAGTPYKPTHRNHPVVKWAGECAGNMYWLIRYTRALGQEFEARFGHVHSSIESLETWMDNHAMIDGGYGLHGIWNYIPAGRRTDFVQCMPDEYKSASSPMAYRQYYLAEKVNETSRWFKTVGMPPIVEARLKGSHEQG
jgi:hypothetical protein